MKFGAEDGSLNFLTNATSDDDDRSLSSVMSSQAAAVGVHSSQLSFYLALYS